MPRYGIAEWFGSPFAALSPNERMKLAQCALGRERPPPCPFKAGPNQCSKAGGVCSIQLYDEGNGGRIGDSLDGPVITCPSRFEQDLLLVRWLAEIVGFPPEEAKIAREIPFMQSVTTNKPAGKIDLIVARTEGDRLDWYGLEIQAVYFSGPGMSSQFEILAVDNDTPPPYPDHTRRPDWRSSSAKRLMPQLQVKVPTLRRWNSKIAVAVDSPFFESIGGPSSNPTQDINDGDIIWLVPRLAWENGEDRFRLGRGHWEVLTLEDTNNKLLAARTVARDSFESALRERLSGIG